MGEQTPAAGSAVRGSAPAARHVLRVEVLLVFGVSLGAAGVQALLSLIGSVTSRQPIRQQTAVLVGSQFPGRPTLDLISQLVTIGLALVPVALAAHLLARSNESLATIGFDASRIRGDVAYGTLLAAVVGGAGLALYRAAYALGVDLTVVPSTLPATWWRFPVLLLYAAQNALLEESLVAGYLLHRLRQMGWRDGPALLTSAVLRGSYHLYQGLGGFAGNLAMGLLFGRYWQRTGRTTALIVAHALVDAIAFVGYAVLVGRVSWLPGPH